MNDFLDYLERESGQPISNCYQCQKCTGGCPVSSHCEVRAHQVVRLAQQGEETGLLAIPFIWYCIGCKTCQARCPNAIDISAIVDVLRAQLIRQQTASGEIAAFHISFLNSVQRHGRVYELGMVVGYKFRVKKWTEDMELGTTMLRKGKLAFLPHRIKGRKQLQQIFELQAKGVKLDG